MIVVRGGRIPLGRIVLLVDIEEGIEDDTVFAGVGGVGSALIELLARCNVGRLLIDNDGVEDEELVVD